MGRLKKIAKIGLGLLLFTKSASANDIRLGWDEPVDDKGQPFPELAGYKVYCGEATGNYNQIIDAGNNLGIQIGGFSTNKPYFCSIKAYDTLDQYSPFSTEVIFMIPDTNPPALELTLINNSPFSTIAKVQSNDENGLSKLEVLLNGNFYKTYNNPNLETYFAIPFSKLSQEIQITATDQSQNMTPLTMMSQALTSPNIIYFDGSETNTNPATLLNYEQLATQGLQVLDPISLAEGNQGYAININTTTTPNKETYYNLPRTPLTATDYAGFTFYNPNTEPVNFKIKFYSLTRIIKTQSVTLQPQIFTPIEISLSNCAGIHLNRIGIEQTIIAPKDGKFLMDSIRLYR